MPAGSHSIPATLAILALIAGMAAHAQTSLPPNESKTLGQRVAEASLVDDSGAVLEVSSLAGNPVVVSPIFTSCPHTCSMITRSLAGALAPLGEPGADFEVLSLSFDVRDTPEDLASYRERMGLPGGWRLARADSDQLMPFLDSIDFRFISDPQGSFTHPNLVVVLTPDLTVARYLYGTQYESDALGRAIAAARRGGGPLGTFGPLLFMGAVVGALLAALVMARILRRTRSREQPTA